MSRAQRLISRVLFLLPLAMAADEFVFNGFNDSSLVLGGSAMVLQNGLLTLATVSNSEARAFFPSPLQMRNTTDGSLFSFSATFIFIIIPPTSKTGDGIAFVLAPYTNLTQTNSYRTFGLLTEDDNGKSSNHLLSIELDTVHDAKFGDIDDNHVGIDINSLNSSAFSPAGYYTDDPFSVLHPMQLSSGKEMQVWIDYDHRLKQLNVTLAPVPMPKPKRPLLSSVIDLSSVLLDHMYIGFSSSSRYGSYSTNGFSSTSRDVSFITHDCVIVDCCVRLDGKPASLDLSKIPRVNTTYLADHVRIPSPKLMHRPMLISYIVVIIVVAAMSSLPLVLYLVVRRCFKYRELREDWEVEFGPHRFSYKELSKATDDFNDKQLLGAGGFGKVYKGVLPSSKLEVAIKVMSHESKQGTKEFIAEVVSMGQLRHRNLLQLLGYCRRKGELLIVYEYMPNGSLDKFLYDQKKPSIDWGHRFEIIKGVASGLLYLHEEWEQVVIHRDVKASNVLLDGEMNGQLGDFGLARLHNHGVEAHTTCVAGTRGYISPELARLGKATKATDVFAFGAFILEVACGRRPIQVSSWSEPQVLVDFVLRFWQLELVVCLLDPRLAGEYVVEEAELVLKLGLLCSHPSPANRPNMRLVTQYLFGDAAFPEMPESYLSARSFSEMQGSEVDLDEENPGAQYLSVQTSITSLSGGR